MFVGISNLFVVFHHLPVVPGRFVGNVLISGARLSTAPSPDLKPGPGCPGGDDHHYDVHDHAHDGNDGDDDKMFRGQVSTSPTCLDGLLVTHCPRFHQQNDNEDGDDDQDDDW